ncbi:MAG: GNAT family N-acetyltransferase [Dehalococcoidia bacterium]|nr:GNAT family N-acetyltransferase [Dehalococcoidia bacterium]|tara:strand:- start:985 stop:1488 length:504 start_codon:yes stop_codon:yes gene_type:complete
MITECTKQDISYILDVINDAALKYKGVIPDDCWHEPYMLEQELISELSSGIRMFGYQKNNVLSGVMGIQELEDVTLIRHAYTLSDYQRTGVGKLLLQHLFEINRASRLLVGTWRDATWAIDFYVKNGFILRNRHQSNQLLKKHWQVSLKQMENSVVLEKQNMGKCAG